MTDTERALVVLSIADTMSIGQVLARSGFFSDIKEQAQAVAKILAGQELGIGPVAALRGINFVKNKMNLDAGLVAALIQRSGRYDYRVLTHTADECKLAFFDGGKQVGESRFTMADAKAAGLVAGDNWQKYPRNMLFARALTNGARWYCPGVYFGAVYSGDELADAPEPPAITVITPEAETVSVPVTPEASDHPIDAALAKAQKATAPTAAPANGKHWIYDTPSCKLFWAKARELGFNSAATHTQLGVQKMEQFKGSLDQALDQLRGASDAPAELAPFEGGGE
jgi:hypothetical protein